MNRLKKLYNEKIQGELTKSLKLENFIEVSDLAQALQESIARARHGDTILFSPAFASFGPPPGGFKNEYDRGEQFVKLVKNL